ncbi:ATP-binding protein [Fulvimarina sp. MAC8]|uniref:ATP-binding protein n=1 Tax=Fulvimarina sp. MAC8 TaxID=3162874 RepID=UPI0032EFC079
MAIWSETYRPNGEAEAQASLAEMQRFANGLLPGSGADLDRISRVRQMYLGLDRDAAFRKRLGRIIKSATAQADVTASKTKISNRFPGQILTVYGNSGAGKTRMLEAALAQENILEGIDRDGFRLFPVIRMQAPAPFNRVQLGEAILRALGMESESDLKPDGVWKNVRNVLPRTRTSLIVIDEAQHAVRHGREPKHILSARDEMKNLTGNDYWPVSIILVGTKPLRRFIETDNQLRRRNTWFPVRPIAPHSVTGLLGDGDLGDVVDAIEEACRRAKLANAIDDIEDVAQRLAFACALEYGRIFDLLRLAAEIAVVEGSGELGRRHFEIALEERTACDLSENSFRTDVEDFVTIQHWLPEEDDFRDSKTDPLFPDHDTKPPKAPRTRR